MLIGYVRVSKVDGSQTTDLQFDALIAAGVNEEHIYEDAVSGKATGKYTHEHAVELSEAASQIQATLKAATTEPALEPALSWRGSS